MRLRNKLDQLMAGKEQSRQLPAGWAAEPEPGTVQGPYSGHNKFNSEQGEFLTIDRIP